MNRFLRQSLNFIPTIPQYVPRITAPAMRRLQPALGRVQERAQARQEQWTRRRQADWENVKTVLQNLRDKTTGWLSDWIVVDGLIEKTTFEVRPNGSTGWKVCERGASMAPLKTFPKKNDAISEGKRLAKARHGHLHIFGRNNSVQEKFEFEFA